MPSEIDRGGLSYLELLGKKDKATVEVTDPVRVAGEPYRPGDKITLDRDTAALVVGTGRAKVVLPGA